MSDQHDEDVQLRASVETLTRHIAQDCREQLDSLRAGFEQQTQTLEAALNRGTNEAVINAAVKHLSPAAADRATRARQAAETAAAQALAAIEAEWRARVASETKAHAAMRSELEERKAELSAARASLAKAELAHKAMAAQHRDALAEHQKTAETLGRKVSELTAERAELLQRITIITAERAAAEAQQRQLESLTEKMSQALAQMLREREQGRSGAAEVAADSLLNQKDDAKPVRPAIPPKRPGPVSPTPGAPVPAGQKKPLQFSQPARDAKRVKIRRGMSIEVEGVPGELVDLSLGGAQALLRQALKPNQLVQLTIPTSSGQIICRGRIVWSVAERPVTSLAVYRTGVKFADVDTGAVETFMRDYADIEGYATRHSSGVA